MHLREAGEVKAGRAVALLQDDLVGALEQTVGHLVPGRSKGREIEGGASLALNIVGIVSRKGGCMVKNTSIRHQIFTCDLSELGGAIERCSESTYKRKSSFSCGPCYPIQRSNTPSIIDEKACKFRRQTGNRCSCS